MDTDPENTTPDQDELDEETLLDEESLGLTPENAATLDSEIANMATSKPLPDADRDDRDHGMDTYEQLENWRYAEYHLARWGRQNGIWWTPAEHSRHAMSSFGLATAIISHRARHTEAQLSDAMDEVDRLYRLGADIGWTLTHRHQISGTVGIPLLAARLATQNVADRLEQRHDDPVGADLARALVRRIWPKPGTAFPPPGARRRIFTAAMELKRHTDRVHPPGLPIAGLPEVIKLGIVTRNVYPAAVFHLLRREVHSLT